MEKTCLKCNHTAIADDNPMAECPRCGAIYTKVEQHFARQAQLDEEQTQSAREKEAKAQELAARKQALAAAKAEQAAAATRAQIERSSCACRSCGSVAPPIYTKSGSGAMELWLWIAGVLLLAVGIGLLILIGALIYSLSRKHLRACPKCGSLEVVPLNTPAGQEISARFRSL